MSYKNTGSVEVDIASVIGMTIHGKKAFDKIVKDALATYCKQKRWKVSECDSDLFDKK